uniref:Ig-like domain-containing protein n=1 Tax=Electrophorus electricus TaxID=8005 RepID=A0A4W4DSA7_ELEEL
LLLDRSVIQASCNDDIELPCTARDHMVKYRYIVWFKDSIAIIKRKSNEVTIYNNSSPASLGVRETLVLQNVQPLDSGQYRCSLGADIGGRDMDSHVSFTVSGVCGITLTVLLASTVLTSTCPFTLEEVSDMWLLLFFLILGVAKVVICSTAIWVRSNNVPFSLLLSQSEKNDLVLKNFTVRQTGLYKCSLIAKVGKTNNHSLVMLNVSGIPTKVLHECKQIKCPT